MSGSLNNSRRTRRRAQQWLPRLAKQAEAVEARLARAECADERDLEALCRLETSLSAAAAEARRLAARCAPEHATFTERRSDEDWSLTTERLRSSAAPSET